MNSDNLHQSNQKSIPASICAVVLSYNHPEHTQKCITSILKTSNLPIILVHNGSQETHVQKLKDLFPQIEHITIKNNKGFSGGSNFGLNHAFVKYKWAFFITNDCELQNFDTPQISDGIYAVQIMIRNTQKIDSLGGSFIPHKALLRHNIRDHQICKNSLYIPGSAFLIDQCSFKKLGGFDESLGTYWEDVDLSQRAKLYNINMGVVKDITVSHKIGKTCRSDSFYTTYLYYRNQKIISRKYTPIYMRPVLEYNLLKNWSKHTLKLIKQKRWSDLKLLKNSIFN